VKPGIPTSTLRSLFVLSAALVAGCITPLPPAPRDLEAKRFEAVPGRAVIYVVRDQPDFTREPTSVVLDDSVMGTSYPGTYFHWVVAPGRHRIAGFASDSGVMVLDTTAGNIYFIQQSVTRTLGMTRSIFRPVHPVHGRDVVLRSELVASQ
jgi:hypothetical protein